MANDWGGGVYSHYGRRNIPNNSFSQYSSSSSIPSLCLQSYQGQFDKVALGNASEELRYCIQRMHGSAVWNRIQRKTDVSIYGTTGSVDGFGEASTLFSHAGLPEYCDDQDIDEAEGAFTLDSGNNFQENSRIPKQSATATASYENFHVQDLVRDDTGDSIGNSIGSDCHNVDRTYSLESDGIEFVQNEAEPEVFVTEEDTSDSIPTDNPLSINELDGNNPEESRYFGSNVKTEQTRNKNTSTFRCDFCAFVNEDRSLTQQHLNKAIHFAASEYISDNAGNMKLKNPMVLMNFKAKFKTVLVVCPDPSCHNIFPDIHVCAKHYNSEHLKSDNRKGRYGLIPVAKEEVCVNVIDPMQCYICKEQFDCRSYLNNHIRDSGHYPLSDLKDCVKIFFCIYCKTKFDTFEKITFHQGQAHRKSASNGALNFTVFHYKSMEYHTLVDGETSTSDEPHASLGTSKRKHDGVTTEMEPKTKISVNNQYTSRTCDENRNDTAVEQSNMNHHGYVESMDSLWQHDSSLPGTSQEGVDCKNKSKLTEMFKCDYCMKVTQDENSMYLHLVHDVHSSASTLLTDHEGNFVYLKKTKTVSFDGANFKKKVAICSEGTCHLLFDTVFMCDDHNIRCHHSKGGYYHLADIVDRIPNKVSVSENVCSVCKQEFRKSKQLNAHYSQSDHFPFKGRNDCIVYTLCCYCNKTFSSYKVASGHVKSHQAMARNGMLDMVILYVSKYSKKYTVPPYQPTKQGEITSIRSKIANLQQMKKICGKSGRSELTKEIREMKHLL
ncbi:uncharacterized protein LOC123535587 isoform X2 [Mercenaria mercenaria]|uniref:uncharacterized protein LOC123535587 isoform X2 n=1 Tax=Mercenaria mercenaria TaxID=6596 RepID=UPI00234F5532|nr:uncharacterized protein LOC123535587 isoform X2 [Mercenaria mercenaria]